MFNSHIIMYIVVVQGSQLSPSVAVVFIARSTQAHSQVWTHQFPPSLVKLAAEHVSSHRIEHEVKLASPITNNLKQRTGDGHDWETFLASVSAGTKTCATDDNVHVCLSLTRSCLPG